jgi:hypothetical protein
VLLTLRDQQTQHQNQLTADSLQAGLAQTSLDAAQATFIADQNQLTLAQNQLTSDQNLLGVKTTALSQAQAPLSAAQTVLANDQITLRSAQDSLAMISPEKMDDFLFAHLSGVEVLSLSGSTDLTLGSAAQNAGVSSIIGGVGGTTVQVAGYGSNLYLDGSASSVANIFTASNGNDTLVAGMAADTLTGGDGVDRFVLGNGSGAAVLVTDFTSADYLDLPNSSGGLSEYKLMGATPVDGIYNQQLFHGSTLVANLNVMGGVDVSAILANQTHLI